jgi:hypothetical protein
MLACGLDTNSTEACAALILLVQHYKTVGVSEKQALETAFGMQRSKYSDSKVFRVVRESEEIELHSQIPRRRLQGLTVWKIRVSVSKAIQLQA